MKDLDFQLQLSSKPAVSTIKLPTFDPEFDSIVTLISHLCLHLKNDGFCEFMISGFGDDSWPVDVATDLAVFITQLPQALYSLKKANSFDIDLFEQGVERYMHFTPLDDKQLIISCTSYTNWMPSPGKITISIEELNDQLERCLSVFVSYVDSLPDKSDWMPLLEFWQRTGQECLPDIQ